MICAPMVDASELAFRELTRRHNVDLCYTPMLHSRNFAQDAKYRSDNFSTTGSDRPLVAQFCANDAGTFVSAAQMVQAQVDAIDLNLGCPQGIARRGGYGAFLMEDWKRIAEIVRRGSRELDTPVWVKIRVYESTERTVEYAKMLVRNGASLVAVHGRTRDQKGKNAGDADWDKIRAVKQAVDVPVVANGNVVCMDDVRRCIEQTRVDGVMSAWALLQDPGAFGERRERRMERCWEYLDIAERYETCLKMVRGHVFKMLRSRLDACMDMNERLARTRSVKEIRLVVKQLEERTDWGGVSFETRVQRGETVGEGNWKKEQRLKKKRRMETADTTNAVNMLRSDAKLQNT